MYNRQLHPDERRWIKDHAKRFATGYEQKTGRAITGEQAEKLLLGTGYMMVDDKARVGPGYDMAAAQFSENSGSLFKATAAERADPGPLGGPLRPEQLALPGHEAHPEIGMALGAGAPTHPNERRGEMSGRLIRIFLFALLVWAITCYLMWGIGIILHCYFNGVIYSPGWYDVKAIARLTLVISLGFSLLAWMNMRRR